MRLITSRWWHSNHCKLFCLRFSVLFDRNKNKKNTTSNFAFANVSVANDGYLVYRMILLNYKSTMTFLTRNQLKMTCNVNCRQKKLNKNKTAHEKQQFNSVIFVCGFFFKYHYANDVVFYIVKRAHSRYIVLYTFFFKWCFVPSHCQPMQFLLKSWIKSVSIKKNKRITLI